MTSASSGSTCEAPCSGEQARFSLCTPPAVAGEATVPRSALPALPKTKASPASPAPPDLSASLGERSFNGKFWQWPSTAVPPGTGESGRGPRQAKQEPPAWLMALLTARGLTGEPAQQAFLAPTLASMADPSAIKDMDAAVARILRAASLGESVCVYGDYDVDGVSASSVISEYLRVLGVTYEVYLPDRRAEGYGLNQAAVEALATRHKLMVTVDCGSTSLTEIAAGRAAGMDTVVIDHHQVGAELPTAVAVLNPHRPDCAFADKDLCATGVAFMLVVALRRALKAREPQHPAATYDVRALLDLVAVATVADMVPLLGLNRVLVHAGLRRLNEAPRPGLQALMQVARVAPNRCTSADLGFRLGPRINARGRLDHAGLGVELMHARTAGEATALAAVLNEANQTRRTIEQSTVAEAIAEVQNNSLAAQAAILVANEAWHPGVLGLVASRLVQRYHRPAVVIGEGGKGSARSIDGLNLHACLTACGQYMLRFGGHPAAAGLTISPDNVEPLRRALAAEVHNRLGPPPYAHVLRPDLEVSFDALTLGTVAELARLEPFGRENPEVLFALRNQYVQAKGRVGDSHLKLRLSPGGATPGCIEAIAFGMGELYGRLPAQVDVLFHLERHEYRGLVQVQMRVVDLRASSASQAH